MNTKLAISISAAAAAAIAAWLATENHRLRDGVIRTQRGLATVDRMIDVHRHSPPTAMVLGATRDAVAPDEAQRDAQRSRTTELRKLWDDPQWRAARFNEAYLQNEGRYGKFFQSLVGWSPERLEALKRQMANNDLVLMKAAMLEDYDSEGRSRGDGIRAAQTESQSDLKNCLGEAAFDSFNQFQTMENCRGTVSSIANAIRSRNVDFSSDMEESALSVYASAMQESGNRASQVDTRQLNQQQLAALKDQQIGAFRTLLTSKLNGVLTEQQLNAFMEAEIEQGGGS